MGNCLKGETEDDPGKKALTSKREEAPTSRTDDVKSDDVKESSNIDDNKYEMENLIEINIIQARGLPSYDMNVKSDPYIKVIFGDEQYRTKKIKKDLNPIWNDRIVKRGVGLLNKFNKIKFEVHDFDRLTKDDFIGSFEVDISEAKDRDINTPVTWHPIVIQDHLYKNQKSEVQIQVKFIRDSNTLSIKSWTDVIQLTINKGIDFKAMDFVGKGDPYVKVQFGSLGFKTKVCKDGKNPVWNETQYLFVDKTKQMDNRIRFVVMDKDLLKDDRLGVGFITVKDMSSTEDTIDIELFSKKVALDKSLKIMDTDKGNKAGTLNISYKFINRKDIEKKFYESLIDSFDTNNNGTLEMDEVKSMIVTLKINDADSNNIIDPQTFMDKFDTNFDQKLDKQEILTFLSDEDVIDSDIGPKLVLNYLKKEDPSVYSDTHLMEGILEQQGDPRTAQVLLKDRRTGLLVIEHTPSYVMLSYRLMYNSKVGRDVSGSRGLQSIIRGMSKLAGKKMDNPKSKKNIKGFVKQHLLDTSIIAKDLDEFPTFNDFFARGLKPDARPIADSDLVSIADCRLSVFNSIVDATNIWVKGKKFSIKNLLGPRGPIVGDNFSGAQFVIFRLAPQDYHRWHYGIDGKVTKVTQIDGDLYAVNPIAVNKDIDIYTDSKRCVIEMTSDVIGDFICVAIGAALVGSYNLFDGINENKIEYLPENEGNNNYPINVKKGEVAGEFRFGGSTCLLLFKPNTFKFDEDLIENTKNKIETIVEMGTSLGNIINNNPTNDDDDTKQND